MTAECVQERELGSRHFGKDTLFMSKSQTPQKKSLQKDDGRIRRSESSRVFVSIIAQTIQTLLCEKVNNNT